MLRASLPSSAAKVHALSSPPPVAPVACHAAPLALHQLSPSANQRLLAERALHNSSGTLVDSDSIGSSNHGDTPLRPLALLAARGCRAASTGDTAPSHLTHTHASRQRPTGPGHVRGNASHSGAIKLVHPSQRSGGIAIGAGPHAHPSVLAASQSTQSGSLRSSESSSPPGCWSGGGGGGCAGSTGVSPPTAGSTSLLLLDAESNTLAAALEAVSPHLSPIGTASLHARRQGLAAACGAASPPSSAISRSLGAGGAASGLSLHASTRPLRTNIISATPNAFPSY